jgi:hypothetical protein
MGQHRFKILDVVQVGDHPVLAEAGLTGRRGAVTQIREYPGPRFRYSVCSLTGDDDDEVGGLYAEEDLEATAERASADLFALPGGFRVRQVVLVAAGCDDPDVAERTGVIDGSYTGDGGIGVQISDLGESVIIEPRFLTATDDRLPAPKVGPRAASSTQVSVEGRITGQTSYIVVDDVDRYL